MSNFTVKDEKNETSHLMSVTDVAKFLKLTKVTVYKLVKTGKLDCIKIGVSIRFRRDYIEQLCNVGSK